MENQAGAGKKAQAALSKRLARSNKAARDLPHNLKIMQKNLAAATICKETDQEFCENYIKPIKFLQAPLAHTKYHHPIRSEASPLPDAICPPLIWIKVKITRQDQKISKAENIDENVTSQSYADALKIKEAHRQIIRRGADNQQEG